MASFLSPFLRTPPGDLRLHNARTGVMVADTLLPALDSASRRIGLLKHTTLAEGTAMIIAPTNAVHTFFMKFAIDVAFVARDGHVLKIRAAMTPWRMAGALRAHGVIELPAGTLARSNTRVGDALVIA